MSTLNLYKISTEYDDSDSITEVDIAIVRAEDEQEAIEILLEDDICKSDKWDNCKIEMIGWATGDMPKEIILVT